MLIKKIRFLPEKMNLHPVFRACQVEHKLHKYRERLMDRKSKKVEEQVRTEIGPLVSVREESVGEEEFVSATLQNAGSTPIANPSTDESFRVVEER
jgi:hypothetical protein